MNRKEIIIAPHVESIKMPENLKIGLMVKEARTNCDIKGCSIDYHGFAFGQSPFPVPGPIQKALAENVDKGHYSAANGIQELREAIAGFQKRHFDLDVDPSRVFVGPGTKDLIHTVFDVIKGDNIVPSPAWIGYSPIITLLNEKLHMFKTRPQNGYKVDPEELDEFLGSIDGDQHLMVLNNPNNPTGQLHTRKELEALTEVWRKHNVLVLADEIYALDTFNFDDFTSLGKVYPEGTIISNGLSKDRSAAGYRLGSLILPEGASDDLISSFKKVAATIYTNVSTPIQYAAITAYSPNKEIEEYFKITRDIHRIMGQNLSEGFNAIDGIDVTMPKGAFYFFVDMNPLREKLIEKGVKTSNDLMFSLIDHPHHIAVVSGDACLLEPDDFGFRVAYVDYDGKAAYDRYVESRPRTKDDEKAFLKDNAVMMWTGIRAMENYVKALKGS